MKVGREEGMSRFRSCSGHGYGSGEGIVELISDLAGVVVLDVRA